MGAPKYLKQLITNIKEQVNNDKIVAGDVNIPLTSMHRSAIQKINKENMALNDTGTDGFNRYIQNILS